MHFLYVKSNILCKWSNILRKFYVTLFTSEHSLLQRSIPLQPPCPPTHPASLQTRPATRPGPPGPPPDQARHSTRPATQPGPSPLPAGLPSRAVLPASSATTASLAMRRSCAVLVLLQRLCVGQVNVLTPPIFYVSHLIFYVPPPKFYVPHLIFYVPHLIFYISPPILYVNLTYGAVDTLSARPLLQGVVNCGVEPPFLVKTWRGT